VQAVENAPQQRHQRHEQEIGEGDAGERDREVELVRVGGKARRQDIDQQRHGDHGQRHETEQRHQEHGEDLFGEVARRLLALALQAPANSGTKAALNAPSPNRRRNRLGKRKATTKASATEPGAQHRGHEHVAHEAEDPARHGEPADGGSRSNE
jgi:hypothetical protein